MAQKKSSNKSSGAKAADTSVKPIKDAMSKGDLVRHISAQSGVDTKGVKAVLGALENTMLGSVHKKGAGQFVMPGLFKVTAQAVAAKKKRFGKDPFTGVERWFDAKPASVRVKVRPLKKLKASAL